MRCALRYEQERLAQYSEPEGGATTSDAGANKPRERVKFAAGTSCDGGSAGKSPTQLSVPQHLQDGEEGGSTPVAVVSRTGFFSFTHKVGLVREHSHLLMIFGMLVCTNM